MNKYESILNIYKLDKLIDKRIEGEYSSPIFEYLKDCQWQFTEKVDGVSIRIILQTMNMHSVSSEGTYSTDFTGEESLRDYSVTVLGRTDKAKRIEDLYKKIEEMYANEEFVRKVVKLFPPNPFGEGTLTIYGEGYGAGINKLGKNYNSDGKDFVMFDIKVGHRWLNEKELRGAGIELGIPVVPVVGIGTLDDGLSIVKEGLFSKWGNFIAEGIVARPVLPIKDLYGRPIKVKIKSSDFYDRDKK